MKTEEEQLWQGAYEQLTQKVDLLYQHLQDAFAIIVGEKPRPSRMIELRALLQRERATWQAERDAALEAIHSEATVQER